MNIGSKIRLIRKERGDSLESLGEKINYNYSNLSKIERGERRPSLELLENIAELYNVPMSYFFGEKQDAPNELKGKGVEWISFINDMEAKELSPKELKEIVNFIDRLKK